MNMRRLLAVLLFAGGALIAIPATTAAADTTNPNACVGQTIHTVVIPADGNVAAHAAAHGFTVQGLLEFIRDVHCA
jgi:hypothetical protein